MNAKCGDLRIWHWAHRTSRGCSWSKPETKWHHSWKARFSNDWQEVALVAADGKRHRADVKTAHGWVLEFQHSPIKADERRSREAFHHRLIWVVDGRRQSRLKTRFVRAFERGAPRCPESRVGKEQAEGALLRTWVLSDAHVFFDFGDGEQLWWLSPRSNLRFAYVQPFLLEEFVEIHSLGGTSEAHGFHRVVRDFSRRVAQAENC